MRSIAVSLRAILLLISFIPAIRLEKRTGCRYVREFQADGQAVREIPDVGVPGSTGIA